MRNGGDTAGRFNADHRAGSQGRGRGVSEDVRVGQGGARHGGVSRGSTAERSVGQKIATGISVGAAVVLATVGILQLLQGIAAVAEAEGHHPDLHLEGWNKARAVLTTHSIGGLSENDFILASKINDLDFSDALKKKKTKFWA